MRRPAFVGRGRGATMILFSVFRLPLTLSLVSAVAVQAAEPPHVDTHGESAAKAPIITEHGKGSFYADKFHGKPTASGEPLDQNALTAASKDLPMGTKAKVTNLDTGKSVN